MEKSESKIKKWGFRMFFWFLLAGGFICLRNGGSASCFIGLALPIGLMGGVFGLFLGFILKLINNEK